MCKTISVKEQAWEFFVYTTLGIVPRKMFDDSDDNEKYINYLTEINDNNWDYDKYCVFMCAKAAYNDLCRTLTYGDKYKDKKGSRKKDLESKEKAINSICVELANTICKDSFNSINPNNLFFIFTNNDGSIKDNFELLGYLKETEDYPDKFYFGQAQKWVNMTLKYLYLLDPTNSDKNLHIPIDSYIIDAAWETKDFCMPLPLKNKESTKREYNYTKPSDYVVAWSKWTNKPFDERNKGEYDLFQEGIHQFVNTSNDYESTLEWEHKNWIRISEKRKGIIID